MAIDFSSTQNAAPGTDALSQAGANASAAPAAPAAPAPAVSPAASSAAPNAAPDYTSDPNYQKYQQSVSAAQAAANRAQADADQNIVQVPGPHARLFSIIQGVGLGLSSAATAMATKGKAGGAMEVQQFRENQQKMAAQKQEMAQSLKDAKVRSDLATMEANQSLATNYMNLFQLPYKVQGENLDIQGKQQALAAGKQATQIQLADFQKQNWGFTPDEITGGTQPRGATQAGGGPGASGAAPASFDPAHMANAKVMLTRSIGPDSEAISILPANDPAMTDVQKVIANPNATPQDVMRVGQGLQFALQQKQAANKARNEQNLAAANDPVAKLTTPENLALPGATAAIQNKIADPTTSDADKKRLTAALPYAQAAHQQYMFDQTSLANAKAVAAENAQSGGTAGAIAAGQELATNGMTLTDLRYSSRNQKFIQAALQYARTGNSDPKLGPVFKGNPQFSAAQSEIYAQQAKAPANLAFFGSANSLIQKGGTLDQLTGVGGTISQSDFKRLNQAKNLVALETGSGPIAAYAALIIGVADDYSKVMGGGVGSDTARDLVLKAIDPSLSPAQRAAAIQQFRNAVGSQTQARMGRNPYLHAAFDNPSEVGGATTGGATQSTPSANPSTIPGLVIH